MNKVKNSRPCPSISMSKMNLMRSFRWYWFFFILYTNRNRIKRNVHYKRLNLVKIINLKLNEWKSRSSSSGSSASDESTQMLSRMFLNRLNFFDRDKITGISKEYACRIVTPNQYQRRIYRTLVKWDPLIRWTDRATSGVK